MTDLAEQDYIEEIKQLKDEIRYLKEEVEYLQRKLFGRSSEKLNKDDISGQFCLQFDEVEVEAIEEAPEPTLEDIDAYKRRRFKGQREEILKNIPHVKRLATLAAEDRFCPECGSPLYRKGEEFVRTEVQFIPAKLKVIDHYRETYECRKCKRTDHPYNEKAPLPYPPVAHSFASPSTIAWAIHQKYELAVPMYRQEQEWKSMGLAISRATLCNWVLCTYRDWFSYIVDLLWKELLKQRYIHIDETPVQVMMEPGRKNTTESYMWVYASIKDAEHPIRLFEYRPGRSGKYPAEMLKNFKGYIHTDAYAGYFQFDGSDSPDIKHCYCHVHLRRAFYDALESGVKDPGSTIPGTALAYIRKLFNIESALEDLSPEDRKAARLDQEKPVLDEFFAWIHKTQDKVLKKGKLAKAFTYAVNHEEGFRTYLEDGNCAISNQLAENSIRPFTIGRKNWLFMGSPRGASASAGVYSLIETAKANGLSPMKYIQYILSTMPGSSFIEDPEYLEDYLPWNPDVQKLCKKDESLE